MEMICAIVHQLTRNLSIDEIKKEGFDTYFVDHTVGLWPQAASGTPFSATVFQSKGDPITDLHEDMAAEQKARTTYDNILRLVDDPDILDPIRFLREREIVHYQRFGETLQPKWNGRSRAVNNTKNVINQQGAKPESGPCSLVCLKTKAKEPRQWQHSRSSRLLTGFLRLLLQSPQNRISRFQNI